MHVIGQLEKLPRRFHKLTTPVDGSFYSKLWNSQTVETQKTIYAYTVVKISEYKACVGLAGGLEWVESPNYFLNPPNTLSNYVAYLNQAQIA